MNGKENNYIVVKTQKTVSKVAIEDIIYVLRCGRKITVATVDKSYTYYEKIDNLKCLNHKPFYFVRESLCINLDKAVTMEKNCIEFENGSCVYTGRDSFIKARQIFYRHLIQNRND